MSRNQGTLTSRNPLGHPRPVKGLLLFRHNTLLSLRLLKIFCPGWSFVWLSKSLSPHLFKLLTILFTILAVYYFVKQAFTNTNGIVIFGRLTDMATKIALLWDVSPRNLVFICKNTWCLIPGDIVFFAQWNACGSSLETPVLVVGLWKMGMTFAKYCARLGEWNVCHYPGMCSYSALWQVYTYRHLHNS
jgi:hypothetical protein